MSPSTSSVHEIRSAFLAEPIDCHDECDGGRSPRRHLISRRSSNPPLSRRDNLVILPDEQEHSTSPKPGPGRIGQLATRWIPASRGVAHFQTSFPDGTTRVGPVPCHGKAPLRRVTGFDRERSLLSLPSGDPCSPDTSVDGNPIHGPNPILLLPGPSPAHNPISRPLRRGQPMSSP